MTTALREPQQERSRATRARLLESAVQLLSELGWSGTTVALVAEHAGVSRGATQHYFPTRETLLTAAIDHMADVRMAELRREAERLPAGEQRIEAVLDILVRIYTGPLFRAALQVWAAAATDETLRDQVVELEARLARAAHDLAVRLLGLDESRPGVRQTVQATLDLARGLGLADVLTDDSRRRRAVVRQWAAMLRVTGVARTGKNGNETLTREQGAVTVSESEALSNLLQENRRFEPPAELAANANVKADAYEAAGADFEGFWAGQAKRISWATEPTQTLDWSNPPFARWFADGKLNAAYNCVDRHVENGLGDRVAYYFEGEPGDTREITYAELKDEVCKAANTLLEFGVKAGDRVAIYMPMIPETVFAMLACARIGAPHTVVFGGFSSEALKDRILDCDARVVITADGGYRRGAAAALKPAVDAAVAECPDVRRVIVVRRTGQEDTPMTEGRDVWWHEYVEKQSAEHTPEAFDAEHPLYVMYTSGTTGKPKGILHTTGGYLVGTSYTHWAVFDLKDDDIFWTAADIGWVTGHSYIVYGALANGASSILYEGTPDTPHKGRWWEIVQKYKVSILYCAPTAIRTFMKWGDDIPAQFDLATLRVIGTVGEPINPEAYVWYRENIGGSKAPVVDTWWQTETGMQMISPLPGVTAGKPGAAMKPLPGVFADVVDDDGKPVPNGSGGYLVLTKPWPAMLRTLWGDDQRYVDTYWSRWPGVYFAGDGAKKDDDGDLWLLGRVDDVMNVAGHRMSTTEIESALVSHPKVAEAAVVGASDPTTGQAIAAFVILRSEAGDGGPDVVKELRDHVAKEIGPIAKPRTIMVVAELPKTRSGKIMRRLLRDVAEKREVGDVTTLADSSVMDLIKHDLEEGKGSDED